MRFENPIWASFLVSLKMPNFGDLKTRYGAKDFRCDIKSRSERCGAKSIAPLKSPLCTSLWFGNTKNVITFLGNTQYQIYSAPEGITEDKRLLWTTRIECEGSGDFRLYTHTELNELYLVKSTQFNSLLQNGICMNETYDNLIFPWTCMLTSCFGIPICKVDNNSNT